MKRKKDYPHILIMGSQGSGKGTQAKALSKTFRIPTISTGELYRRHMKKKTKIGIIALRYLNRGELAPNKLTNAMMAKELRSKRMSKGFIADGYPRNIEQAQGLEKVVMPNFVILLTAKMPTVIRRLSNRRECENCGTIYHLINMPPKSKGICDVCGGKLVQREDDKPAALRRRLEIYRTQTKPLISRYKKMHILFQFDGEKEAHKVQKQILGALRIKKFI